MSSTKRTGKPAKPSTEAAPSPRSAPPAATTNSPQLILRGAQLVELQPARLRRADVTIQNGRVRALDDGQPAADATVIDCGDLLLLPGMLSADARLHSAVLRTLPRTLGATLGQRLQSALWRYEAAMPPALLANAVKLGALEALRAGTTSVLHRHSNELAGEGLSIVADALAATGLRAAIGVETSLRLSRDHALRAIRETEQFMLQRSKIRGRVRGLLAAESIGQLDNVLADALSELVARHQAPLLLGLGDGQSEREKNGVRVSAWLRHYGLANEQLLACGGTFLDTDEVHALAQAGAGFVMSLRTTRRLGLDDPRRMLAAERLLLGTGLDSLSVFAELDAATAMQAQTGNELNAPALLTRHHNVLAQIYDAPFGRIEVGMVADLVLARYRPNAPLTEDSLPRHLSFGLPGIEVVHAIVDGEVVLKDGQHPQIDEPQLRAETHKLVTDLLSRI